MEKQVSNKKKQGFFSNLLFWKSFKVYFKGRRKEIQVGELCTLWRSSKSKKLGEILEQHWENVQIKNQKVSIIQVLWRCFGPTFLFFGVLQAFFDITVTLLAQPYLVGKIVSFFTLHQTELTKKDALWYVYILIAVLIVKALYRSSYTLMVANFGIEVRTALCSFLYRKILRSANSNDFSSGKILTLITKDVQALEMFTLIGNCLWICVFKVLIICCILYAKVGLPCFVGIGCFLLVMPLQIFLGGKVKAMKMKMLKETDQRLQIIQETISGIRLIKMYTWESFFVDKIHACRKKEMNAALKMFITRFLILTIGTINSEFALYLTLMVFITFGNTISGEVIYFIALVSRQLIYLFGTEFPDVIYKTSEALTATKRFDSILRKMETKLETKNSPNSPNITTNNLSVSIQKKPILKNITLKLQTGLTIISGPVGSGKTIFLKTLLNNYRPEKGLLTVQGSLSYASQEPWLFPATIKKNILMGEEYDQKRYEQVLKVCALSYDLQLLKNGDATIIEDRGANLSKGQQARVNLARAVYRKSDIYLLDSPLSSLDANVATLVFEECVKKFLKNKIVVMVTHDLTFFKEATDFVYFDSGRVNTSAGSTNKDKGSETEDEDENRTVETALLETEDTKCYHENGKTGKVSVDTYRNYGNFGGGVSIIFCVFFSQATVVAVLGYKDVFVSNWVNSEEQLSFNNSTKQLEEQHKTVLHIYGFLMILLLLAATFRSTSVLVFSRKASIKIHKLMVERIIYASISVIDRNFHGNIMNRFSKDLTAVDEILPFLVARTFRTTCLLAGSTIVVALVNQHFLVPATTLFLMMVLCRKYTIKTSTSLKRLETTTRSPVVGHINATLEGLTTIRALKAEETLRKDFDHLQDVHASTSCAFQNISKAFIFVLDVLAALFNIVVVTRFFIVAEEMSSGDVGLAVSQAFLITGGLHMMVSAWTELENQMTSTERVLEYTNINIENSSGCDVESWPKTGKIVFKNVSLLFSGSLILNNINLEVEDGEKIGIVGRTGAGKSSLISTLFRMFDFHGKVTIDDVDIKTVSLNVLRSNISIIPQEPFLFSATIRQNIDPFGKHPDNEIWTVLDKVNLKKHFKSLDLEVVSGNFSVGEKQLLCLARAILQKNKIVVLDEATSSSDVETEKLIYKSIEENFSGCTVITVAHKLQTVVCSDRIFVLEKGSVVESGKPSVLMQDESSVFCRMMVTAGLVRNLK